MSFLWALWEIAIDAIEILIFVIFLLKQLGYQKNNRFKIWIGYLVLVAFQATLNVILVSPFVVVLLTTASSVSYSLLAFKNQNNQSKCIFWGCTGNVVSLIANGIVNNIAVRKSSFPGPNILAEGTFRFEMMCLYILVYAILFAVLYYSTKNKKELSMPFSVRVFLLGFLLVSTVATGLVSEITILSGSGQAAVSNQIVFLSAIITAILFVIIIYTMILFEYTGVLYNRNFQLQLSLQQQRNEASNYQNMQEAYQDIREWKHDYHNHLLVLEEYAKTGEHQKLQAYLRELNQNFEQINWVANTGNTALDAILYNKMLLAKRQAIPFTCQIALAKPFAASDLNLCSILGNLLDNALEASVNLPENLRGKAFIDFKIATEKQMILITIINYYSGERLYQDGKMKTTKKDLAAHGIGLSRAEKLLQQENGFLNLQVSEHIFTAEVLLPAQGDAV